MNESAPQDGTVGKALSLLDLVARHDRPVRFTTLLHDSGFPKATTYRFLQTLTNQGMLSYDPEQQTYSLGGRLVRLAHSAWRQATLAPIARPYIDALSEQVGETVHLAQLDHGQVLYVDKRNPKNPIPMFSDAGKIGPCYCTGVGKAMLAFLPPEKRENVIAQQSFHVFTPHTLATPEALREELTEIRDTGIAFDAEEHEPGIICIAAPIISKASGVLGGVSVTSSTERTSLAALSEYKIILQETAKTIGEQAENWRFPDAG